MPVSLYKQQRFIGMFSHVIMLNVSRFRYKEPHPLSDTFWATEFLITSIDRGFLQALLQRTADSRTAQQSCAMYSV